MKSIFAVLILSVTLPLASPRCVRDCRYIRIANMIETISNRTNERLTSTIYKYGTHETDKRTVAQLWQESKFDTLAVSHTGDYGIAQVNLYWHPECEKDSLLTIDYSVRHYYRIMSTSTLTQYNGSARYERRVKKIMEEI